MPYVVRNPADLRMLCRPSAILRPFRKARLLVRIPQLSAAESLAWERRLDPLAQECGCNAGTIAVGVFLLLDVAAVFLCNIPGDVRLPIRTYLIWAACFLAGLILSALMGKLIGQTLAALRLRRACQELELQLNSK